MKKELILESLIKTYLNENNPISSNELKRKCELSFSASTIRNYFQKLDEEGLIVKVHISSGRIPSKEAIKRYWYENLDYENIKIDFSKLRDISKEYDVFISLREKKDLILKSVLNVENRFVILDFVEDEIVFRYSDEIINFFREFIGYDMENIKKILESLKLNAILDKFVSEVVNFNKEYLYKNYENFYIDKFLSDKVFTQFEYGLSFNNDYLAYKTDVLVDDKKNEFVIIGDIYKNYIDIFESIKEEI